MLVAYNLSVDKQSEKRLRALFKVVVPWLSKRFNPFDPFQFNLLGCIESLLTPCSNLEVHKGNSAKLEGLNEIFRAGAIGLKLHEDWGTTLAAIDNCLAGATTLLALMTIRAFHSKILGRCRLGTAIEFRVRRGLLTDIPAILVFVACKIHRQWLTIYFKVG
ncbi:hypothetical protein L1987_70845 [Smallanthus sonchifolius]|uniref:Uncharacterized protein n=1 Tax=Smallanthus sonchifolius TaxID=185202 RepID=A0ACB9AQG1_9ASTR|nr:hypothetical protein L1987_70845 [Smallanthus sonchifolius]